MNLVWIHQPVPDCNRQMQQQIKAETEMEVTFKIFKIKLGMKDLVNS